MSSLVNAALIGDGSMLSVSAAADFHPSLTQAQREIDDLRDQVTHLHRELNTDTLTQIANRRALTAYAQRLAAPAVIALVDLDKFKPINDTYGHLVGDQVLKAVAHRLRAAVVGKGLAARLGGDEFALIIGRSHTDADISATAQRILCAAARIVSAPLAIDTSVFTVGASIGAAYMDGSTSFSTALHQADVAMYQAKSSGTDLMFYEPKSYPHPASDNDRSVHRRFLRDLTGQHRSR